MSRFSPCSGGWPCFSTKRWISSKPAIMRSSRAERPPFFSGCAKASSSARSSSRSSSLIASFILEAHERGRTFRKPLLPCVRRGDRGKPSALLLEPHGAHREILCLLRRQSRAFGRNRRLHLFKSVLVHRLGEDRVCLAERIDPINKINIELAYVHGESAKAIDQRGIGPLLAIPASNRDLLRLLCQVKRRNGMLTHRLLVFLCELGKFLFD